MNRLSEIVTSEFKNRIRFKSIKIDADTVYNRLWERIEMQNLKIGVSPVWKYVSIAACIALIGMSSFLLKKDMLPKSSAFLEVTALADSKTYILLPDSTEVWLNGDSWVRYPESFDGNSRTIELVGEAHFNVVKDAERPFSVNMNGLSVQVLGTAFNILAKKHSNSIETTLLEGSVALYKSGNKILSPDLILSPGEQAIYNRESKEIEVRQVQASHFVSWLTGRYIFEEVTFEQIIEVLERSFQVKFHLKNKELKDVHLTAKFTNGESLNDILSVLQISMKYKYAIEDKEVFIE